MNEELSFPKRKKGLLNIYFHVSENSGVGYYRQYLPAWKLREKELANTMISDFRWGIGDHKEPDLPYLMKILNWADIAIVGRKDQAEFYAQWGAFKDYFKLPLVVDTDDNVQHVRPSNPGYQGYYPGSEAITWNKFGISKVFDAVTVSTQNLFDWYKKYNPKIFLLPNSLDVEWWKQYEKRVHTDGLIRIGFICSASHGEGVHIIKQAMIDILKKYPNTRLLITSIFRDVFKGTDVYDKVESIPWINLENWPKDYKNLGLDIGLAPLADNLFNRAKSNLRWMEYALQGIPSVVSPVEAYSCVQDGKDALIAKEKDDWFIAIEKLVIDKDLREAMGNDALHRIEAEYNIDRNIHLWADAYRDIHDKYHDFFGKKKQFAIGKKGLQEMRGFIGG